MSKSFDAMLPPWQLRLVFAPAAIVPAWANYQVFVEPKGLLEFPWASGPSILVR
ncbi:MAG TPA: hypothetical protein PLX89_14930 [Verrucomicrobiota bacterium]|nr:hypothetical protein [Verrucomicrobiota bacterium]